VLTQMKPEPVEKEKFNEKRTRPVCHPWG